MATSPPGGTQNDDFALPGASLDSIKRILKAYGARTSPMAIGDVAKMLDTDSSAVSRNSRFLLGAGLISSGATRTPTSEGREMLSAMSIDDDDTVRQCWNRIVDRSQFLKDRLATLSLKGPLPKKKFTGLILETSGKNKNASARVGARAVVELLIEAGRIRDDAGSLTVVPDQELEPENAATAESSIAPVVVQAAEPDSVSGSVRPDASSIPPVLPGLSKIAINIELHIPETRNAEVYQKLFRALREELLQPRQE